jgi:crotonobetainyl-CoA:carnitine CoA-transferase CaiB-like acyl-CoA transferase
VYGIDQLIVHPQLLARDMIVRLPHETVGEVTVTGVPVKLSDTPGTVRHLGPTLGQHNEEIYRGLLGLSAEEMDRLRAADVI